MSRPKGKTLTRKDVVAAAMRCLIAEGEPGLGVNRVARELVHAIRMFVAACHGFVLLERSRQFNYPTPLDDSYEWMVQTFIAALENQH